MNTIHKQIYAAISEAVDATASEMEPVVRMNPHNDWYPSFRRCAERFSTTEHPLLKEAITVYAMGIVYESCNMDSENYFAVGNSVIRYMTE